MRHEPRCLCHDCQVRRGDKANARWESLVFWLLVVVIGGGIVGLGFVLGCYTPGDFVRDVMR